MKDKTVHLNLKPEGGDLISESYLMDCILGMKEYPDKYFDLAVVDPPYGVRDKWKTGGVSKHTKFDSKRKMGDWDIAPDEKYFLELFRVSKNQVIWGANHYPYFLPFSRCWIVWDKLTGENQYGDCELAFTSFDKTIKKFTQLWLGAHAREGNDPKIHPTQKPVKLYDWIYRNYAEPGQRILDTHLGSGSSRIAAHKNGLHFVGFEIDEEYYYSQEERFKSYLSQPTLFDLPRAVGVLNSNAPTLNFEQSTEL
jgi:site-specific DNA-methyltransferase (adenine-specific)